MRSPFFLPAAVLALMAGLRLVLRHCERRPLPRGWSFFAVFLAFFGAYALSSRAVGLGDFAGAGFPFAKSLASHYVLLADALLHGRLDIAQNLVEIAVSGGKIYLMEPVFPALLMLPFVAVFGEGFYDVLFLAGLGALNVALVHGLWPKLNSFLRREAVSPGSGFWLTLLFGLGTAHWYLSVAGRVWHTEGVTALFCLLLAVHEALGRGRPVLLGLYLGWAFLSHPPTILSLPFFQAALSRGRCPGAGWRELWLWLSPGLAVLALEIILGWGVYNYLRFGSFFETGLSQAVLSEPARRYGLMSWRHLPGNFLVQFLGLPALGPEFPYFKPETTRGFSLFLATPAFLYIFKTFKKNLLALGSWTAFVSVQLCLMLHHTTGWVQFGHRRSLDFMPFLLILTALGMGPKIGKAAKGLIGFSIFINFLGLMWFYRLN